MKRIVKTNQREKSSMIKDNILRNTRFFVILYWVLAIVVFIAMFPMLRYKAHVLYAPSASMNMGVITDGDSICQRITVPDDYLDALSIMTATYDRVNNGSVTFKLRDEEENTVAKVRLKASTFKNNEYTDIHLPEPLIGFKNKELTLEIQSSGVTDDNMVTYYIGQQYENNQNGIDKSDYVMLNDKRSKGMMCIRLYGRNKRNYHLLYWIAAAFVFATLVLLYRSCNGRDTQPDKRTLGAELFCYTVCSFALILVLLLVFRRNGKAFAWGRDSFTVEYPARLLLRQTILDMLKRKSIPGMFNFSIGIGMDITSFLNTWYLDPINLLVVLFPSEDMEIAFTTLCVLEIYCSELSFFLYAKHWNLNTRAIIPASLIYSFCGLALFYVPRHPCFLAPMIYMPMLFLSVELLWQEDKRILPLIGMVFISSLSSYFYFYINTLLLGFYVLVRFIFSRKYSVGRKINRLLLMAVSYCIGVGISAFALLPAIYFFLDSNRTAGTLEWAKLLMYTPLYYYKALAYTVVPHVGEEWLLLGIAPIGLFGGILALPKLKKHPVSVGLMLSVIFIVSPFFGRLFAAFSTVNNRFAYVFPFFIALAFCFRYEQIFKASRKQMALIGVLTFAYGIWTFHNPLFNQAACTVSFVLMEVTIGVILYLRAYRVSVKHRDVAILALVCVSIAVNTFTLYDNTMINYQAEFNEPGQVMTALNESNLELGKQIDDDSFYRIAPTNVFMENLNSAMSGDGEKDIRSISLFHNTISAQMTDYYKQLQIADFWDSTMIFGFDNRYIPSALASVKYSIERGPRTGLVPNSTKKYYSKGEYKVYQWKNSLSLGYTYDAIIPESALEKMTPLEKQEAMVKGAIIPDEAIAALGNEAMVIDPEKIKYWNKPISYTVNGYDVKEDIVVNNSMQVYEYDFVIDRPSEVYAWVQRTGEGSVTYIFDFEGRARKATFMDPSSMYGFQQDRYLVNLGTVKAGKHALFVRCDSFTDCPVLNRKTLKLYAERIDRSTSGIEELAKNQLNDVVLQENRIEADIVTDHEKLLCFSIPYTSLGWTIYVDGVKQNKIKTNLMYMGTMLEKGKHHVTLIYETPYLKAGIFITIGSLLLCVALAFMRHWKRKKERIAPRATGHDYEERNVSRNA